MKKILLATLGLLFALVLLSVIFIQPIANHLGNWQLKKRYPGASLHISELTSTHVQLQHLDIDAPAFQLQLLNADIHFQLSDLFAGQLDSLLIESLNLKLLDHPESEANPSDTESQVDWPDSPLEWFPLQKLQLQKVLFQAPGGEPLFGSLNLGKDKQKLDLQAQLEIAQQPITLSLDINHQWQLNLQLSRQEQVLLSHHGRIQQGKTLLAQGTIEAKGADILKLLEPILPATGLLQAHQLDLQGQYKISSPWPLPLNPMQQLTGELDFHLSATQLQLAQQLEISQANSSLTAQIDQGQASWSLSSLNVQAQPAAKLIASLPAEQQSLLEDLAIQLLLPQPLKGHYQLSNGNLSAEAADLRLTLNNKQMDHKLLLSLAHTEASADFQQSGKVQMDLRFDSAAIPFKRLSWSSPYQLSFTDNLQIALKQSSRLNLYDLQQEDISLSQLAMQLNADSQLNFNPQSAQLSTSPMHWHITQNTLHLAEQKINPLEHDLRVQLKQSSPLKVSGSLSSKDIQGKDIPATDIQMDFNLDDQLFSSQWQLASLQQSLKLSGKMQHQLDKQQGNSSLLIQDIPLNSLQLAPLLKDMPLTLLDGQLFSDMQINWQLDQNVPLIEVSGELGLKGFTATYEDILLEELDLPLSFKTQNRQPIVAKGSISLKQFNPGVPIENITGTHSITLSQDLSQLRYDADNINMQVLGGSIEVPLIRYDSQREVQAVGIYIKDLLLDKLDLLKEKAGLSATGKLNGALPIVISKQGISIPAGTLKARNPGGNISHDRNPTVQALSQSSQQMKMVFEILENFNYDEMSTDVLLQADGQLSLSCRLQGENPGYLDGQAINFNPHLDINIIDAMKVMRLTNKTTERFEKYFQGQ